MYAIKPADDHGNDEAAKLDKQVCCKAYAGGRHDRLEEDSAG